MSEPELFATLVRAAVVAGGAWVLLRLGRGGLESLRRRGRLSSNGAFVLGSTLKWGLVTVALVAILQQFGVSVAAIWTALSAVMVLVAVGFVALWSVLSNMLCALFLVLFAPFRIGDRIEIVELVLNDGTKRGVRGKVTGIDLIYTTLEDEDEANSTLRIPNNMLFQRAIRTIHGEHTRSLGSELFPDGGSEPAPAAGGEAGRGENLT